MSDAADKAYEAENQVGGDVPVGLDSDNDYKSRTGQSHIPVQSDDAGIESGVNPATEDSDAQLRKCSTYVLYIAEERIYLAHFC